MTTITVPSPLKVTAPRGAWLAAACAVRLLRWWDDSRQARAQRRQQADRQSEAAELRRYARRFAAHDPRFTSDLLAAADRHERND